MTQLCFVSCALLAKLSHLIFSACIYLIFFYMAVIFSLLSLLVILLSFLLSNFPGQQSLVLLIP